LFRDSHDDEEKSLLSLLPTLWNLFISSGNVMIISFFLSGLLSCHFQTFSFLPLFFSSRAKLVLLLRSIFWTQYWRFELGVLCTWVNRFFVTIELSDWWATGSF
jgi:hypothetical protein